MNDVFHFLNLPVSFTDEGFNSEFIHQPVVRITMSQDRQMEIHGG